MPAILDSHTHIGLESFLAEPIPEAKRSRPAFKDAMGNPVERLIARMDANGVQQAIAFGFPLKEIDRIQANDYVLAAQQTYPERIIPFMLVGDDTEYWLTRGAMGFKQQDILYESSRFDLLRAYHTMAEAGVPMLIHFRAGPEPDFNVARQAQAAQSSLAEAGKTVWAEQEFTHQMRVRPATDPQQRWRRTNSAGRLRNDAQRGALRALWLHRDALARERDVAWHRVVRDQVMVEMAKKLPTSPAQLAAVDKVPKAVVRDASRWLAVIAEGASQPIASLERADGPPARSLRAWEQRDPQAAARWTALRAALTERAEELHVWMQTLLAPDIVADLAWSPAEDPGSRLAELGARPWQVEHTADLFEA